MNTADTSAPLASTLAQVRLTGPIDGESLNKFLAQLNDVPPGDEPILVEVTTMGGDAEMGRRLALEAELAARRHAPRRLIFVGKTSVFSAGVTTMSGFPRENRYLTADAVLLIHTRQLDKPLHIKAPLAAARQQVAQILSEIENGQRMERIGFEALIAGSDLGLDELMEKAADNWYVPAAEALERGLIAGIL